MAMIRRFLAVLVVVMLVAAGIVTFLFASAGPAPQDSSITVVDSSGRVVTDVVRPTDTPSTAMKPPPALKVMMEEAPQVLQSMHAEIEKERDANSLIDERRVTELFAANPQFAGQPVGVSCIRRRCEVHGSSDADEDVTRLAIRDGDFLDRVAAAGYSSGIDMVSGRPGGSEFIVYLESGRSAP